MCIHLWTLIFSRPGVYKCEKCKRIRNESDIKEEK